MSKRGSKVRPQAKPGHGYDDGVDMARSARPDAESEGEECETVGRARAAVM